MSSTRKNSVDAMFPQAITAETRPLVPPTLARLIDDEPPIEATLVDSPPKKRILIAAYQWFRWVIQGVFRTISTVAVLALLAAVPGINFIAFGYLLDVSGKIARGRKLREGLPASETYGYLGLALAGIGVAWIAVQMVVHQQSVATIVNPDSSASNLLRFASIFLATFAMSYLGWVWVRGGRLRHYLWPAPIRFLKEGWRWSTWSDSADRFWTQTASLEWPRLFWLGLRGFLGTLIWLIPAIIVMAAVRDGDTGLAGLIGGLAMLVLAIVMAHLPMLQVQFAADNRLKSLFEIRRVRASFRAAPWAWLVAMFLTLILLPLPLYLLKIEATPAEVVWLPTLFFVAFILPARIASGLAMRRAWRQQEKSEISKWGKRWGLVSRISVRLIMPALILSYLAVVYASQYTSWDGYATWIQQHAVMLPIPFERGT
ncbi:MAG: DUF4013 domain-containing protein [Planctomycetota bacterium]